MKGPGWIQKPNIVRPIVEISGPLKKQIEKVMLQQIEKVMLQIENIPKELRSLNQWVCWRKIKRRGGRTDKVPVNPHTGNNASAIDPHTWAMFDQALNHYQSSQGTRNVCAGIGFVFSKEDPYTGIDLDKCRSESGQISEWAWEVISDLNTYTEISQSETGIHLIVKGRLPEGRRRKDGIEMYDTGRFFVVTGIHLYGTPKAIESRQDVLDRLHAKLFPEKKPPHRTPLAASPSDDLILTDQDILEKAKVAKNGDLFDRLWRGDTSGYASASEADLALCDLLAFWTQGDAERIDSLFRQSGLYREKWERENYRKTTIAKVLEGKNEFYSPRQRKRERQTETPAVSDDDVQTTGEKRRLPAIEWLKNWLLGAGPDSPRLIWRQRKEAYSKTGERLVGNDQIKKSFTPAIFAMMLSEIQELAKVDRSEDDPVERQIKTRKIWNLWIEPAFQQVLNSLVIRQDSDQPEIIEEKRAFDRDLAKLLSRDIRVSSSTEEIPIHTSILHFVDQIQVTSWNPVGHHPVFVRRSQDGPEIFLLGEAFRRWSGPSWDDLSLNRVYEEIEQRKFGKRLSTKVAGRGSSTQHGVLITTKGIRLLFEVSEDFVEPEVSLEGLEDE